MRSQLIHLARQMGAGGIWLPPAEGFCRDVSGYGRHAYLNSAPQGQPFAIHNGTVHPPAWDGVASGTAAPYIASIPDIGEANSLMSLVYIPTGSETGAFAMLTNNGGRGLGHGVGNGSAMENAGNIWMTLNETIAWHSTGWPMGTGWKFLVMSSTTGTNNHKAWADGVNRLTTTRAPLSSGTVNQLHLGGYYNSVDRVASVGISLTAWWDRALTDQECDALWRAARRERVAV